MKDDLSPYLEILIPVRDRETSRIKNCIKFLKKSIKAYMVVEDIKITILDYSSKIPIKLNGINVLRIEGQPEWNKAHCLNIGIKQSQAKYIMVLDVDMIIPDSLISEIFLNLNEENYIVNTNVRRILKKDIKGDFKDMVKKSTSWNRDDEGRKQYCNEANGGVQVYSKEFWNRTGGIPESLGKYWGAEDNFLWYVARLKGLTMIDISTPLLHVEHKRSFDRKISKEEGNTIAEWINYKQALLEFICKNKIDKNLESSIAGKKPCLDLYNKFLQDLINKKTFINNKLKNKEYEFEYMLQKHVLTKNKPSVCILVVNNYDTVPNFFMWDILNLYNHTKLFYPDCVLQPISACDVNLMRNLSVKFALGENNAKKRYDYMVMLDTDQRYSPNFLVDFIKIMEEKKLPIIVGLSDSQRNIDGKHYSTQYLKLQSKLNEPSNCVDASKKRKELVKIEGSGPVGMVINTSVFEKMSMPYYFQRYEKSDSGNNDKPVGGDIWFTEKCKELGIPIYCHTGYAFPHWARSVFYYRGQRMDEN